jgi:hypothetical protein
MLLSDLKHEGMADEREITISELSPNLEEIKKNLNELSELLFKIAEVKCNLEKLDFKIDLSFK